MKVGVFGAGSWGSALSIVLSKAGHDVALIGRNQEEMNSMSENQENVRYLPGVKLPKSLSPTTNLAIVNELEILVLSVPSHAVRDTARLLKPYLQSSCTIVNTAKGLELDTHKRLSEVLHEELPSCPVAILSGPSHAEEVGREIPTTVVIASDDIKIAEHVQDVFMTSTFRVYTNPDVIGVELGGALKNIIALCTGVADGLNFGDNTKAALMTRGLAEIARLGVAMGGNPLTFAGLAGIGDLIVTCTSNHSRNRRAGFALGQGKPLELVLKDVGMVVEGVRTTKAAYELSREMKISMPITEQAYKVLYQNADPKEAVSNLMQRGKKHELEEVAEIALKNILTNQNND